MVRTTKNAELARRFLAFALTEPFQSALPETNWMYPARTPATGLPASFQNLARPERSLQFAPEELRDQRRSWIDQWLAALSR